MMNTKWLLGVASPVTSPSWAAFAERYAALLEAIAVGLPGDVTWSDHVGDTAIRLDLDDTDRLTQILLDGRLFNNVGELMPGAGSNLFLTGQRSGPTGTTTLLLTGGMGGDKVSLLHASLEVKEPGELVWSYSDEIMAQLIGGMLTAVEGDKARVRDRFLHRLMIKTEAPFDVGSHVYMAVPLDDPSRFPPGARQVRCGEGWLLIVPPGAGDEETLQRMRWVAAAIGAA